jgi:hypothetical protein
MGILLASPLANITHCFSHPLPQYQQPHFHPNRWFVKRSNFATQKQKTLKKVLFLNKNGFDKIYFITFFLKKPFQIFYRK